MSINFRHIMLILCFVFSCNTENVVFDDLVEDVKLTKQQLIADGKDSLKVEVFFNKDSNIGNISGTATINNATILESKMSEIDLEPIITPDGNIVAEFVVNSTTINTDHVLEVNVNEYEESFEIESIKSLPATISLEVSSSSVGEDFSEEIRLEATIKNERGNSVSNGTKVVLTDFFDNGTSVNGFFRDLRLSSNNESKVSAFYTPGIIDSNQFINIKIEVLDSLENLSGIIDIKRVFITPKE